MFAHRTPSMTNSRQMVMISRSASIEGDNQESIEEQKMSRIPGTKRRHTPSEAHSRKSFLSQLRGVEMLYYITMCQLTILYSFRLRLVSHLYSVDSPVCFFSSSIIIGSLISDFIRLCALLRLRRCHFRSDFRSRS